jgi:hypothetical protein
LQTPKSKIDKKHSYAIFPYKNNNHIFYNYSEINQKEHPLAPPVYFNMHPFLMYTWSPIRTFKMCIASPILVTGTVNWSQNVYCVSDYNSCINWVKIGKQEPGSPFSKLLDPHLMQQWFWGYFHKKILRLTLIVSYIGLFKWSQNVYCVSDYCQRLWHMYSWIRSESRRPDVRWHLYILPGNIRVRQFSKIRV